MGEEPLPAEGVGPGKVELGTGDDPVVPELEGAADEAVPFFEDGVDDGFSGLGIYSGLVLAEIQE